MKYLKITNTPECHELFKVLMDKSVTSKGERLLAVMPEFTRPFLVAAETNPRWVDTILIPEDKIKVCPWTAAKLRFWHTTRYSTGSQGIFSVRFDNGGTEVQYLWDHTWVPESMVELSLSSIEEGNVKGASLEDSDEQA